MDFLLPIWNPFIVHPMEQGLRLLAAPLEQWFSPGMAGGLAIIIFTILLRLLLAAAVADPDPLAAPPDGHPARAEGPAEALQGRPRVASRASR